MVAKQMGAAGASTVMKVGGAGARMVARGGGAMTFGLAARGGRATLGQGANMISNSKAAKEFAARNPMVGKAMQRGLGKVADSSFDARKAVGADKLKVGGVDLGMGTGRKGGVTSIIKETEKSDKEFDDWLGKDEKAGEGAEQEMQPIVDTARDRVDSLRTEKREVVKEERNKIKILNQEYKTASEARKQEIASQVNSLKAEIDLSDREFDELIAKADTQLKKAQEDQQSAKARALYQRQTQYRNILDQRAETYKRYAAYGGAAVGVGAGAAALISGAGILGVAGVAAAGGITTIGGMRQYSDVSEAQKKAIDKEYGSNTDRSGNVWVGNDKDKNEKRKKDLKDLSEELKKEGGDSDKKDSEKKDDSKSESK
jgi:hypothetical protein